MISSFLLLSLAFGGAGRAHGTEAAALRSFPSWEKAEYSVHFTAADLHRYLNGGAAKYLAYSISDLYVQEYQRISGGLIVVAELYLLDSPQNAFGVYSCDSGGGHPEGLWMEASFEGGLLQFWQGRSYVRIYPRDPAAGAPDAVMDLGLVLSEALHSVQSPAAESGQGASKSKNALPEIVTLMPSEGLVEDSICFFHLQVSLNSIYYLSEKNVLHLTEKTDAVSAEYGMAPDRTARVITVRYPGGSEAAEAYEDYCNLYFDKKVGGSSGDRIGPERSRTVEGDSTQAGAGGRAAKKIEERWGPAGESEWLYAGLLGRVLTLVMEATTENDAVELGRNILTRISLKEEDK